MSKIFNITLDIPMPTAPAARSRQVTGGPKHLLETLHASPIGASDSIMAREATMKQTIKRLMLDNPNEEYNFITAALPVDDKGNHWCRVWHCASDSPARYQPRLTEVN
jgi:hypothetical protein